MDKEKIIREIHNLEKERDRAIKEGNERKAAEISNKIRKLEKEITPNEEYEVIFGESYTPIYSQRERLKDKKISEEYERELRFLEEEKRRAEEWKKQMKREIKGENISYGRRKSELGKKLMESRLKQLRRITAKVMEENPNRIEIEEITPKTKAKEIFNRITSPVDDFIKKKKSPPEFPSEEKLPYECKNCGYRFSAWDKDKEGNLVCPNCGAPKLRFYEHGGLRIEKKELKNYFKCPVCGSRDIKSEGDKFKCKKCGYIGEAKEFVVKNEEHEEGTFSEIIHSSFTPVAIAAFIGLMVPVIFGVSIGTALIAVGIIFLGLSKI